MREMRSRCGEGWEAQVRRLRLIQGQMRVADLEYFYFCVIDDEDNDSGCVVEEGDKH